MKRKLDFAMLDRLVQEAKDHHAKALEVNKSADTVQDYVVELSKLTGLLSGIAQECSLLVGDTAYLATHPGPNTDSHMDLLSSILSKKPGSN
jgi:hypothetical protein